MDTHGPGDGGFEREDTGSNESAPQSGAPIEDHDTSSADSDAVVIAVEFGAGPGGRRRTGRHSASASAGFADGQHTLSPQAGAADMLDCGLFEDLDIESTPR